MREGAGVYGDMGSQRMGFLEISSIAERSIVTVSLLIFYDTLKICFVSNQWHQMEWCLCMSQTLNAMGEIEEENTKL